MLGEPPHVIPRDSTIEQLAPVPDERLGVQAERLVGEGPTVVAVVVGELCPTHPPPPYRRGSAPKSARSSVSIRRPACRRSRTERRSRRARRLRGIRLAD